MQNTFNLEKRLPCGAPGRRHLDRAGGAREARIRQLSLCATPGAAIPGNGAWPFWWGGVTLAAGPGLLPAFIPGARKWASPRGPCRVSTGPNPDAHVFVFMQDLAREATIFQALPTSSSY